MIYTYGFCLPPHDAIALPQGIQSQVQLVQHGTLCAIVEPDVDYDAIATQDEALMQAVLIHDRVLQYMFQHTTILPLRFGTQFYSQEGLAHHIEERQQTYEAQLQRFQNQGEYLLKLIPVDPPEQPIAQNAKGKDYFLAKKQRYQSQADYQRQRQTDLDQLKGAIAQTYPKWVHSSPEDGIERIYLLIDQNAESDLHQQCRTWQQQFSTWEMSLSAPLPPYHFV